MKSYLAGAFTLKMQINLLVQQIQELEYLEERVGGAGGDSVPLQEEIKALNRTVKDFVATYEGVKKLIFQVNCKELQTLLILRYLKGDSWPVVAEKMNYSMSGIYYKHVQALEQIESLLALEGE